MFFDSSMQRVTKKDNRKEGVKTTVGSTIIIKDPTVAVV
ncbi:hypothetical protein THEMA_05340 [Thermotoga maritima MSB8]|nr:hypothetical protein THEMA_05340 [Thermotoga maritima MSB8]